jgi:hypothetical protein
VATGWNFGPISAMLPTTSATNSCSVAMFYSSSRAYLPFRCRRPPGTFYCPADHHQS